MATETISVKVQLAVNEKLNAIVEKRKAELNPAKTKQGVMEELIIKAYKREIKQ